MPIHHTLLVTDNKTNIDKKNPYCPSKGSEEG